MIYKLYPVVSQEDYQDKCIEAVTGETSVTRTLLGLTPLFYNLAMANTAMGIMSNSLREAGLIKRSYYKRNKRYWRTKSRH